MMTNPNSRGSAVVRISSSVALAFVMMALTVLTVAATAIAEISIRGEYDLAPAGGNGIGAKRITYGNNNLWISDWGNNRATKADTAGNVLWSLAVGSWPVGIAIDEHWDRVFVANFGDGTVSVINSGSLTVHVPPVGVGSGPIEVVVNQTTDRVYVANQGPSGSPDTTVTVIDADTLEVLATVPVGDYPNSLTIDEVSNQIYVSFLYESYVAVIDGVTHGVTTFPALSDRIRDVAIDRAGDRMYLCDKGFNRIGVYVYSTKELLTTFAVGYQPSQLFPYLDDGLLYVLTSGAINVVDLATQTVTDTLTIGAGPSDMCRFPGGSHLYVANGNSTLHTYTSENLNLWHRQPLARFPRAVAADASIGRVYAATYNAGEAEGSVWAMGDSPPSFRQRIPVAVDPLALAVNPVAGRVYVGHGDEPTVTVINSQTNQVATTIAAYAHDLAIDPVANRVYFMRDGAAAYGIIDGYTATVLDYVSVPWQLGGIEVDPGLNRVFISSSYHFAVVTPATGAILYDLSLGSGDIAVDAEHHLVYLADFSDREVHVINGATGVHVTSVPVDLYPGALAVDPSERLLYAVGHDSNDVRIIDTLTNTVVQSLTLGPDISHIACAGTDGLAYASMETDGSVQILGGPELFADGFESGDLSAWSGSAP